MLVVEDGRSGHISFNLGWTEERVMRSESRQAHWKNVYTKKAENELSWFQENPAPSL